MIRPSFPTAQSCSLSFRPQIDNRLLVVPASCFSHFLPASWVWTIVPSMPTAQHWRLPGRLYTDRSMFAVPLSCVIQCFPPSVEDKIVPFPPIAHHLPSEPQRMSAKVRFLLLQSILRAGFPAPTNFQSAFEHPNKKKQIRPKTTKQ